MIELLLLFFILFFAYSFVVLVNLDVLYAGIYFFLFLYIIFVIIGYTYVPIVSEIIKAYFGAHVILPLLLFVFGSFISFFILTLLFYSKFKKNCSFDLIHVKFPFGRILFFSLVTAHTTFLFAYFFTHYQELNYSSLANEDYQSSGGVSFVLFVLCFKYLPPLLLLLYALKKKKVYTKNGPTKLNLVLLNFFFSFLLILFIGIANKVGNRTDILSFLIGLIIFEYSYFKEILSRSFPYLKYLFLVIIVGAFMNYLKETRTQHEILESIWYQKLLLQDYYAPGHILIASINFDYVQPLEVIKSNLSNMLFRLGVPYLQTNITEIFNPGVTTRSASYAYYIFTEGYMFMGYFGFLYNGIAVFLGVSLWRSISLSTNSSYNLFMLALVSERMATCVRSQTSFFIKDFYMIYIPFIFLYGLQTGLFPKVKIFK